MKVTPNKDLGQDFKVFEIEVTPLTWSQRCELNDKLHEVRTKSEINFSFWGSIVLKYTTIAEEELNKYSTDEILAIANGIIEETNKKK